MTAYTFRFRARGNEPTLVIVLADSIERATIAASSVGKGRKIRKFYFQPINGTTVGVPHILHTGREKTS